MKTFLKMLIFFHILVNKGDRKQLKIVLPVTLEVLLTFMLGYVKSPPRSHEWGGVRFGKTKMVLATDF
jgi:hypothetical protein